MADIKSDVTGVDVRRAAMDLLARREHSFRELDNKLTRRFGENLLIYPELDRLRTEGLQSDERFAEVYLFSRAQRLYGPQRIKAELRERGINDTVVEAIFKAADTDWHGNLEKLATSKFGDSPAMDFKEKAKRMRFLQYRGFSTEMISELIR